MTSDEAADRLRTLLREAGIDVDDPTPEDVGRAWAVVERFAAEDVEDAAPREEDGDGILAQYGIFSRPVFELDMTRQLTFYDEDGEYDHMSQLQCTFEFEPTDELRALPDDTLWSYDEEDFFAAARGLPGFRLVEERGLKPLRLVIAYDEV